jgi:uncharacterized protein YjcR
MSTGREQGRAMSEATKRKAEANERKKATAKRAYEGGEMAQSHIAEMVGACESTLARWIKDGGWRK